VSPQPSRRWRTHLLAAACVLSTIQMSASLAASPGGDHPGAPSFSAAGLFNTANAYARSGKPGLAVLNYERAHLLAPGDDDVAANERHVLESVHLPLESPGPWQRAVTAWDPTAMAWLGLGGSALVGAALLAGLHPRGRRGWRWWAAGLGAAALALTAGQAAALWPALHAAVVIAPSAPVLVSPVPMGNPLFTLPEAETVRVLGTHGTYTLIRTRTGRTGWVTQANVVPVAPDRW